MLLVSQSGCLVANLNKRRGLSKLCGIMLTSPFPINGVKQQFEHITYIRTNQEEQKVTMNIPKQYNHKITPLKNWGGGNHISVN